MDEIDLDYLESTGLTQEVSERMGLDADEAAASLQKAFAMMSAPRSEGQDDDLPSL